jgi:hypothetical protein
MRNLFSESEKGTGHFLKMPTQSVDFLLMRSGRPVGFPKSPCEAPPIARGLRKSEVHIEVLTGKSPDTITAVPLGTLNANTKASRNLLTQMDPLDS